MELFSIRIQRTFQLVSTKNFIEDWNKGFFATFFVRHHAH